MALAALRRVWVKLRRTLVGLYRRFVPGELNESCWWNGENDDVAYGIAHSRLLYPNFKRQFVAGTSPVAGEHVALFEIHAGEGRDAELRKSKLRNLILSSQHMAEKPWAAIQDAYIKLDQMLGLGGKSPLIKATAVRAFTALIKEDELYLAGVSSIRCDCVKDLDKSRAGKATNAKRMDAMKALWRGDDFETFVSRLPKKEFLKGPVEIVKTKLSNWQYLVFRTEECGTSWRAVDLCSMLRKGLKEKWSLGKTCEHLLACVDWDDPRYEQAAIVVVRNKANTKQHEWGSEPHQPWYRSLALRRPRVACGAEPEQAWYRKLCRTPNYHLHSSPFW